MVQTGGWGLLGYNEGLSSELRSLNLTITTVTLNSCSKYLLTEVFTGGRLLGLHKHTGQGWENHGHMQGWLRRTTCPMAQCRLGVSWRPEGSFSVPFFCDSFFSGGRIWLRNKQVRWGWWMEQCGISAQMDLEPDIPGRKQRCFWHLLSIRPVNMCLSCWISQVKY